MLVLGSIASQNTKSFLGDFESISTVTVGAAGSSTVTFSSIPSTYSHLQIRALSKDSRNNANSAFNLRFNGVTSASYSEHGVTGDGSIVTPYSTVNATAIGIGNSSGGTNANIFGVQIIDILDYANTNKNTTVRTIGGHNQNSNGAQYLGLFSGAWYSTAAVTSITILPLVANITQYSSFALYGIK